MAELDKTVPKEQQIRSFYADGVAVLDRIYCNEMIQHIKRLDKIYEEGNCSTKRKSTIGEIMLDACKRLTEINREAYAEAVKPYVFKYRTILQGISPKQQAREDISEITQALETIYNVTLTKESHMAKGVDSFIATAYKKLSVHLEKEGKEQIATYRNSKMTKQDWKRELNHCEGFRAVQILQQNLLKYLPSKKSADAIKRVRIATESYQQTK